MEIVLQLIWFLKVHSFCYNNDFLIKLFELKFGKKVAWLLSSFYLNSQTIFLEYTISDQKFIDHYGPINNVVVLLAIKKSYAEKTHYYKCKNDSVMIYI